MDLLCIIKEVSVMWGCVVRVLGLTGFGAPGRVYKVVLIVEIIGG